MPNAHKRAFLTCLVVANADRETLPFARALHDDGIAVLQRAASEQALQLAGTGEFDLVAWFIEPRSAVSTLALAHLSKLRVPVIALVHDAEPLDIADSLAAGAEACIEVTADPRVIVAQVKAVLRRTGAYDSMEGGGNGLLQVGDLTVDVDRCEVQRAGAFVALTAHEFRIVEYMARKPGRVLKPHEILNAVTDDYEYLPREAQDVLKVYVRRIRRKLEPDEERPRYLVTVRGFGYRLEGGGIPAIRSVATTA